MIRRRASASLVEYRWGYTSLLRHHFVRVDVAGFLKLIRALERIPEGAGWIHRNTEKFERTFKFLQRDDEAARKTVAERLRKLGVRVESPGD